VNRELAIVNKEKGKLGLTVFETV